MRRTLLLAGLFGLIAFSSATAQDAPAPSAAPAPTPAPLAGPAPTMVESIKIVLEDKAKTDGEIRFDFTPQGGATKAIRVTVAKKMSNKEVAKDLEKELKVALGADYKVDRYDPDKIKVEAKKKDGKFHLSLAALTATGLSVRLK